MVPRKKSKKQRELLRLIRSMDRMLERTTRYKRMHRDVLRMKLKLIYRYLTDDQTGSSKIH